eukprot:5416356-Alexandrium_andersonii.AAC.1
MSQPPGPVRSDHQLQAAAFNSHTRRKSASGARTHTHTLCAPRRPWLSEPRFVAAPAAGEGARLVGVPALSPCAC